MPFSLPGLSGLSPVNSFPDYHGPYDVGTVDVEIPVSDLPSPANAPTDAAATIAFRIFYPCVKPGSKERERPVRWIPQPQKPTVNAFAKFLGAGSKVATLLTYMPQHLFWIKLPAHRNAAILQPETSNNRWPVTVFSHGLAGSRNAYSYVCGDMASSGMIVIAMDHRDGSSPIQYVRATATSEAHTVPAFKIPHEATRKTYEGRDKQLRIRLWEICTAFEGLVKIDAGERINNLDNNTSWSEKERSDVLQQFEGMLDIRRPGKVSWAGHSFGAATTVQLLKSIYYANDRPALATSPLITPQADAAIVQQILPESPTLLLDMWCLPFKSPDQEWLWDRPLPSYVAGGPCGDNVLSVLSEAFWKWEENRVATKHMIAGPKAAQVTATASPFSREQRQPRPSWAHLRDQSPSSSAHDSGYASESSHSPAPTSRRKSDTSVSTHSSPAASTSQSNDNATHGPYMFYPTQSQHFNQSDFGVLFPWIAKRVTKAEDPEEILHLNVRAMVQVMREAGIEVGGDDDKKILERDGGVKRWTWCPVAESDAKIDLAQINRRLSATSTKNQAPVDEIAMGMESIET